MSLYNTLFGENEDTSILLGIIKVNKSYFDRFRDIYLCNNGEIIRVYTRIGGDNRKYYEETWDKIRNNEYYEKDFDDDFDNTYAYIDFKVPKEHEYLAKKMFVEEPIGVTEKFKKECEEMNVEGTEAYKRAEKIAEIIMGEIERGNNIIGF